MEFVDYTTVPHLAGVELGSAGMEWPAGTGPVTFTVEHLADVVTAANDDPHVQAPRLKLGHYSEINGELQRVDPFTALGDAAPAFGRVVNLRLENDGAVLVGDFAEVPEWLADAMPSAFANRSGEWTFDVETPGGKRYSLVLSAMALLGLELPAVQDLEDLERLMSEGPEPSPMAASRTRSSQEEPVPRQQQPVESSVSVDVVRRRFNFDWAMDPDSVEGLDTYWWWARDIRVDPGEVIADDDEGNLWRVPYTTDGEDEVTFDKPTRVRVVYVDVAEGDAVATSAPPVEGQRVLASNLGRPKKDQPETPAASRPRPKETSMSIDIAALRSRLQLTEEQLPDDATEEQINEALAAEEPETPTPEAEVEETETVEEPEPVAAARGVTVDRDALSQLQADAAAGREARVQQLNDERTSLVEAAVKSGRFPRSAAASYRKQLDRGGEIEASTREFIAALPENTIPVEEIGSTETEAGGDAQHEQIMAGAFGITRKES